MATQRNDGSDAGGQHAEKKKESIHVLRFQQAITTKFLVVLPYGPITFENCTHILVHFQSSEGHLHKAHESSLCTRRIVPPFVKVGSLRRVTHLCRRIVVVVVVEPP